MRGLVTNFIEILAHCNTAQYVMLTIFGKSFILLVL